MSAKPDNEGRLVALFIQLALFAISAAGAIVTGLVAFLVYARIFAALLTAAVRMHSRINKLRMKNLGAPAASKNGNPFAGPRARALHVSAADLGLNTSFQNKAYGVIMETGYPEGIATLVCFATGDASLYFSTGGGMIGGAGHEANKADFSPLFYAGQEVITKLRESTNPASE